MLTKNPQALTLEEINEELEFAGIDRVFTKLKPAQDFITKAIKKGDIIVSKAVAKDLGVEEVKQDNKPAKAAKPKKEKPVYDFSDTELKGSFVFTSGGKAVIEGYDAKHDRFQVKLADGTLRDYSKGAVRFKAVNDEYREKYVHDNSIKTESGSASIHCGDEVSGAMLGLTSSEVRSVAIENGLEEKHDQWQEKDLNHGMIRMNLGNMLRARHKKGEKVTFFGKEPKEAAELRDAQLAEERKQAEKEKAEKAKKAAEAKKEKAAKKKAEKAK